MRNLYESILRPDDDIVQSVEVESILKKHGWWYKNVKWEGKTLVVINSGERVYLDELDEVAEELNCRSFRVYPWAVISAKKPLDGLTIQAETRIDITAPKVTGCKFITKQMGVTITKPKDTPKLVVTNCDFNTRHVSFDRMDGVTLSGNNFNDVEFLTLKHVGPKIEKIVLGWNLVTNNKGKWSTYPYPKGQPDPNMDPFKDLGLDKHFKNLTDLNIALGTGGNDEYISFSTRYKRRAHDWGVRTQVNLNSGWQCNVINDARCI